MKKECNYIVHYIGGGWPKHDGLPHSGMAFSSIRTARTWMRRFLKSRHLAVKMNKTQCVERIWKTDGEGKLLEWRFQNS